MFATTSTPGASANASTLTKPGSGSFPEPRLILTPVRRRSYSRPAVIAHPQRGQQLLSNCLDRQLRENLFVVGPRRRVRRRIPQGRRQRLCLPRRTDAYAVAEHEPHVADV